MWPLFAVLFMLDLMLLLASNMTDQPWASATCSLVFDVCDYNVTLKIVGVLSFALMILAREF